MCSAKCNQHRSPPGFRISRRDMLVMCICAAATWLCWRPMRELALLFPITLGHFFLFCNVFHVQRVLELTWAAIFVGNLFCWTTAGLFSWQHVLLTQTPVTLAIIIATILRPDYHGVFCGRLKGAS